MRSDKPVMSLEECCHPYRVTFTKEQANVEGGIFQSINYNRVIFPLDVEVELTEAQWAGFKNINKTRHFLPEYDYNPFQENEIQDIVKASEMLNKAPVPRHDRYIYDGKTNKTYYIK